MTDHIDALFLEIEATDYERRRQGARYMHNALVTLAETNEYNARQMREQADALAEKWGL